jgi:hypothetical protein
MTFPIAPMRLLLEVIVAAALIALAWQKSFKDWTRELPVIGSHITAATPPPKTKPAVTAPSPQSFTDHIYYTDDTGKRYWLDAQGKRHYDP